MPTKKIEEAEEVTRCPECNSGHLSFDYERGELICEECGLVLTDQMIDQGPEWRAVDVGDGAKRAGTGSAAGPSRALSRRRCTPHAGSAMCRGPSTRSRIRPASGGRRSAARIAS